MNTAKSLTTKLLCLALFFLIIQSTYCQNELNTIFVNKDAQVRSGIYNDENYGATQRMEIKSGSRDNFLRDGYLQFDLDDYTSIDSARLLVYGYAQTTMSLGAYQSATANWNENNITWNRRPAKRGLTARSRISTTPSWIELDITDLAQDRTGRLLTVVLSDPEAIKRTIFLSSKEENFGQFQARLVIEGKSSVARPKDIYLVIGQSNAAGRGTIQRQDRGVLDGVFLLNDAEVWEPARNPMNAYSTIRKDLDVQELGFAYTFAEKMHAITGNDIGMVVNARGGSRISSWKEGDEDAFFEEAYKRVLQAMRLPNTTFKGILWHQGESNRNSRSYLRNLENMIMAWRDKLNMPDMPFIAGQLSQLRDSNETFNKNILTLPSLVPNTGVATTENLNAPDLTHFDSKGQRILGSRYADAFLKVTDTRRIRREQVDKIYYIDNRLGSDLNSGTSISSPWKTLKNVNATTFLPGTQILFKAGESWVGTMLLKGSGNANNPIVIGRYGNGDNPIIHGEGKVNCSINPRADIKCTIHLANVEYWEINDLEITNFDASEEGGKSIAEWENNNIKNYANVNVPSTYKGDNTLKCGILIEANDMGAVNYLHFNNIEVHGVNGNIHDKDNGGIYIEVYDFGRNAPTYFNDLSIDNCHIHDVDRTGISNVSAYDNRSLNKNDNWTPSQNFRVTNTTFERTGANALIMRVADAPLVENCLFDHCSIKESGNAAFFFNVDNGIMQYNEFRYTKANVGDRDAGGPDIDYRTKDCILQYNYLHDNDFGLLVTGGPDPDSDRFNDNPIIRYNIIERDGKFPHPSDGKFVLKTSGNTTNAIFHNNVIYLDASQVNTKIVWNKRWSGSSADGTKYQNNIIYNLGRNSSHDYGASTNNTMSHNLYFENTVDNAPGERNKTTGNPLFANPGNGPNGYIIRSGSPAIAKGIRVSSLPSVDYFGNPIDTNTSINIGAHQFIGKPTPPPPGNGSIVHITKRNARGFAIDGGSGGTNRQAIKLSAANTSDQGQLWVEIDRGNGFYSYEKFGTNFSLDGNNGGGKDQDVYLYKSSSTNQNQQWQKQAQGDGSYKLIKRNATGYTLNGGSGGVEGRNITLWDASVTNQNLQWYITPIASDIRIEAEDFDAMSDIQTEDTRDTKGGENVGFINNGDWLRFDDINLSGMTNLDARVATRTAGGTIEVRIGSPTGTLIGIIDVSNTGGFQNWTTTNTSIRNTSGTQDVYLVFTGGSGYLFNVNWIEFNTSSKSNTKSNTLSNIGFYPNPVTSILNFQLKGLAVQNIQVYNIAGQVVASKIITDNSTDTITMDLSNLSNGVYFAKTNTGDTFRLVKAAQ